MLMLNFYYVEGVKCYNEAEGQVPGYRDNIIEAIVKYVNTVSISPMLVTNGADAVAGSILSFASTMGNRDPAISAT